MIYFVFFFFKQKTAYEISSRDWSSDVCSSDLVGPSVRRVPSAAPAAGRGDPGGCPPGRLAPVRCDDLEPAVPDFLAPHVPAARPRLRPRSPHVPVGVRAPDASLPWDRGLFEAHGRRLSARGVRDPRTSAAECLLSTAPR